MIAPSHRSESPSSLPTTSTASLSAAADCSARSRTDAPTDSGWASSSTALPLTVVATGAPSASATARSGPAASTAPPPATISGLRARRSRSAAARTASAGAAGVGGCAAVGAGPVQGASSTSRGISMCTGRGLPVANAENAAATASAASSGEDTRRLHATIRSSAPVASLVSCSLPRSEPVPVGAPGESSSTGRDSAQDVAAAAAALSRPGPDVVTTTPGRPDTHAAASAAYPAPCSWRGVTGRIPVAANQRYSSRLCVPGMPNTVSTPCAASVSTTAAPPLRVTTAPPARPAARRPRGRRRCR